MSYALTTFLGFSVITHANYPNLALFSQMLQLSDSSTLFSYTTKNLDSTLNLINV